MGVYNPKKKMPTSCYMCWDSLYCEYKIKNPVKMAQGRADDCPLIEIVTCGECIHRHEHEWYNTCDKHIGHGFEDDYFCKDGKGKPIKVKRKS